MAWTRFYDMSSGGFEKLDYSVVWIEAPENEACDLFEEIFGLDPHNVTCPCCGTDYWVSEKENPEIEPGHAVVTAQQILQLRNR
jgi:hypothetical protein